MGCEVLGWINEVGTKVIDYCTEKQVGASYKEYVFNMFPKMWGLELKENLRRWDEPQIEPNYHFIPLDKIPTIYKGWWTLLEAKTDFINLAQKGKYTPFAENNEVNGSKGPAKGPLLISWEAFLIEAFLKIIEEISDGKEKSFIACTYSYDTFHYKWSWLENHASEFGETGGRELKKNFWECNGVDSWHVSPSMADEPEKYYKGVRFAVKVFMEDPSKYVRLDEFVQSLGFDGPLEGLFTLEASKEVKSKPRKPVSKVVQSYKLQDQYGVEIDVGDTVVYPKGGSRNYYYCRKGVVDEILYLKSSTDKKEVLEKSFIHVKDGKEDSCGSKTIARKVVVVKKADGTQVL